MKTINIRAGWWVAVAILGFATGCSKQVKQQRHLERAEAFFAQQRYPEAIIEYLNVLQAQPTNGVAIRQLGFCYFATSDYNRAFPLLARTVAQAGDDVEAKTKLATLLLAGGAADEAQRLANEVLQQRPGDLDALLIGVAASTQPEQMDSALVSLVAEKERFQAEPRYQLAVGIAHMRRNDLDAARTALDEAVRLAPDKPDGYIARGELLLLQNRRDEAAADFRLAYEKAPGPSAAAIRWALFLKGTGKAEQARAVLEEVITAAPQFMPALYERAALDYAEGKMEVALSGVENVLAKSPDHLPSLLLRSAVYVRQGKTDEALKELQRVATQFPKASQVHLALAQTLLRKGQVASATTALREALKWAPNFPEAILTLAEVEIRQGELASALGRLQSLTDSASPAREPALLLLGTAHRLKGNLSTALATYEELSKLRPGDAQPLYLIGETHRAAGRNSEAAASFAEALKANPAFFLALTGLVGLDMEQAQPAAALARIDEQLKNHAGVAELHYLRATVSAASGDLAAAESSLQKAIELQPKLAAAYRDLGRLYVTQQRIPEALSRLQASVQENPGDTMSRLMIGVLQQQEGRLEEAMASYEEVLKKNPNMVGALNNLAYLLTTQPNQLDRALELAQRARELAPADPSVADTLGRVALEKKDYRWALTLLQESVAQLRTDPEVLDHLAQAHYGLGQEESARAALEKALAAERDFPGRDRARQLLSVLQKPLAQVGPADEEQLQKAREVMPDSPSVLVRLAALRRGVGDGAAAIALHEEVLRAWPEYLPSLLGLTELLAVNQPERALEIGRKARALAPQDPAVAHALGWAAYQAADYAWARSLLFEAASGLPDDPAVQLHFAEACILQGQLETARQAAQKVSALSASSAEGAAARDLLQVMEIYTSGSSSADSASVLASAQARHPDSPLIKLAAARTAPAPSAPALYEALVARYPTWSLPARDLAALRVAEGKADETTQKLAQRARESLPEDPVAVRTYALVMAMRGMARDAILPLRTHLAQSPNDGEALYWLGRCERAAGQTKEALSTFALALAADLPEARRAETLKMVEEIKPAENNP